MSRSNHSQKKETSLDLHSQVIDALNSSGAINHISAELFAQVAKYANEKSTDKSNNSVIASKAKTPETTAERLAARLVFEYLTHRNLLYSASSLKNECPTSAFEVDTPTTAFKQLSFRRRSHFLKQLVQDRVNGNETGSKDEDGEKEENSPRNSPKNSPKRSPRKRSPRNSPNKRIKSRNDTFDDENKENSPASSPKKNKTIEGEEDSPKRSPRTRRSPRAKSPQRKKSPSKEGQKRSSSTKRQKKSEE
ncbi:hypothetical protein TRFO_37785 [Tritrichomonas foetus]|uniref:LisH domain-containing protein n=1 Tax=Tritrichomonas foetus TaxID=1144522 RepID=A0A1J4JFU1_9EUKA|nr:hypothetical protein TRFO_37785 [Tritrichomonas foetus]|eukprot:OHS96084.1 hypothetical protein TRFO_37785 [Tritrichomonas foetus]